MDLEIKGLIAVHTTSYEDYAALVRLHEEVRWLDACRAADDVPVSESHDTERNPVAETMPAPTGDVVIASSRSRIRVEAMTSCSSYYDTEPLPPTQRNAA
jgi:hypothetical protein